MFFKLNGRENCRHLTLMTEITYDSQLQNTVMSHTPDATSL